jgi:hypothetical protein
MPRHSGKEGFLAMRRKFEEAAASGPTAGAVRRGRIAGRRFEICLAGPALAKAIGPAFAHLMDAQAGTSGSESASVRLWDCEGTGIGRPDVPGEADWVAKGEGWRVTSHGQGRYLCEERASSLLWLDRLEAQLVGCFMGADLGCADRARPLQRIMSEFCRSLRIQEIHAGLVSQGGRGVLIVGGGGRGKSTTSLDGLHEGLHYLGDDSVAIGEDEAGGTQGYCLYASARVRPAQLHRWPRFSGHWHFPEPPEEKALLLPGMCLPHSVDRAARIVAIAIPAIAGRGLHVSRTSGLDAFHALVHDSRDNRRFGLSAAEFSRLTRLTKAVPCYRFEVDDSPQRVAGALAALIGEAAP